MNSVSMLAPASCGTVPPETRRWMTERRSRRRWRRRVAGWMRTKSPTAKSLVVTSDVRTGSTGPCGDRAVSRERWTLAIRTGSKPASSGVICSAKNELQPRAESSSCSAVSARVLNGASDEKGLSPSALQYRGGASLPSCPVPQRLKAADPDVLSKPVRSRYKIPLNARSGVLQNHVQIAGGDRRGTPAATAVAADRCGHRRPSRARAGCGCGRPGPARRGRAAGDWPR